MSSAQRVPRLSEEWWSERRRPPPPQPFHLPTIFSESTCASPLVFILSPGSDPLSDLLLFAENSAQRVESVSLGQGQGPIAQNWINKGVQVRRGPPPASRDRGRCAHSCFRGERRSVPAKWRDMHGAQARRAGRRVSDGRFGALVGDVNRAER